MAVAASNVFQVAWLAGAGRISGTREFGAVLGGQALYAVLQIVVDNGSAFEGARSAAREPITAARRASLVRARLLLALLAVAIGTVVALLSSGSFLDAAWPFAPALVAFATLNVWEAYGQGNARPYASYLAARSAVLMIGVGVLLVLGLRLPIWLPAGLEMVAIATVGVTLGGPVPGLRAIRRAARPPWATIASITAPALLTQYSLGASTIVLSAGGAPAAASVIGVSMRLLTGLHGLNGALIAGVFPRLARTTESGGAAERWVADRVLEVVTGISVLASGAVCVAAPLAAAVLLPNADSTDVVSAMVVVVTGAAFAACTLQTSFALIARGQERTLLRFAGLGAGVVTVGAALALAVDSRVSLVAAIGFVGAQAVVAVFIARTAVAARVAGGPATARALAISVAVAAAAIVAASAPEARAPIGIAMFGPGLWQLWSLRRAIAARAA